MEMPLDAFLTALYTIVDDWYQAHAPQWLRGKVGRKPLFSDAEVITLSLAHHWCSSRSEREWRRFIRHNFRPLFPRLVSQSEFNVRARNLCWLIERMRHHLLEQLGARRDPFRLVDGTPVHVRHWRRYSRRSLCFPEAALGYCFAKREAFYGYRLVTLCTLEGVPTDWTLIPGNADERQGAEELLEPYRNLTVLGDKGFLDEQRQAFLQQAYGNRLLAPKRANQKGRWSKPLQRCHNRVRQRIEVLYSQAKERFGLEKPGAHTWWGFLARLIAKLTGLTLAAWANLRHGRSPLGLAEFAF